MKILFFLLTSLFLFASDIIIQYPNLKNYYYENQIVNLKIKVISSSEENISINTPQYISYKIVTINPFTHLINLYFRAISNRDYKIIIAGDTFYQPIDFTDKIKIKTLNSFNIQNFSNIIASDITIENPIASKYDNYTNMISFTIKYKLANINDFYINSPFIKEEKITLTDNNSTATFYAIVDKKIKYFTFYYFNTQKEKYEKISIPINIKEEKISTQTNLKPEENTIFTPINLFLITLIFFSIIIAIIFNSFLIGFIPVLLTSLLIYINLPKGEKKLRANSKVYILPIPQSIIFLTTQKEYKVQVLKTYKNYSKIKLNQKIGWVKNEDIY